MATVTVQPSTLLISIVCVVITLSPGAEASAYCDSGDICTEGGEGCNHFVEGDCCCSPAECVRGDSGNRFCANTFDSHGDASTEKVIGRALSSFVKRVMKEKW